MNTPSHPVIFAGAGPGDPELITVKAQRAMGEADLVVYAGSLVPEAMLRWAKPDAEIINSAPLHLDEIVDRMADAHRKGKRVVRLHTGDPSLYGAVFEQMMALEARSIPYAIIPGVTAASAAAAALGIEFTLPEISQTLILTRIAGRTPVPEREALAGLAGHQCSMVVYLSMSRIDDVASALISGYGAEATCAVVFCASQPEEKVLITPLRDLAKRVREEKITRQAIVVVGKVLDVRKEGLNKTSKLYDKDFKHGFRG